MKKYITILIGFLFINNLSGQIGSWEIKNSMGNDLNSRADAGMVALNNKLYILGGYDGCGPKDFTEYNPATGNIKKLANLGTGCSNPIYGGCMFAVQGKIYSISGNGRNVYDTLLNSWTYLGGLNQFLIPDAGFVIDDTIYLTSQIGNNFYSYNIHTNTFTQRASYPSQANRRYAIAFEINGKGYWGSGITSSTDGGAESDFRSDFYEYDPTANNWTQKTSLPYSFRYGIGVGYNGLGYIGMGAIYTTGSNNHSNLWYEYNPQTNGWTQKANALSSMAGSSTAIIGDELYLFGGNNSLNNIYSDNIYKYSFQLETWAIFDEDPGKNRTEASGFYANGKIYVGGGHDSEGLVDFWEFDIATSQWTRKKNFNTSYHQRSCIVINGKGYFLGGYRNSSTNRMTDSLIEYNPELNNWTVKANFPGGQRTLFTSFAYNGNLFAGLGYNYDVSSNIYHDFYKYNPSTNAWLPIADCPAVGASSGANSSFVLGDTAYIVSFYPTSKIYKYSMLSDSWSTSTHNLSDYNTTDYTNQAFVFNDHGYIVHGAYNEGDILSEYDPTTGIFKQILSLPFKRPSQTIIPSNDGIYFGFGEGGIYDELGISKTNAWQELKFNAEVSNEVGLFASAVSSSYVDPIICGTGTLSLNASHAVSDSSGKLFSAIISKSAYLLESTCYEVNSRDTLQPYREICGNIGKGYSEKVFFLNKSILFNGTVPNGGLLRIYFTSNELNKFVQEFNIRYHSNNTIDSIKIFQYFEYYNNDHDPLNNDSPNGIVKFRSPLFADYGTDKYIEIESTDAEPIMGELYAVLSKPNLNSTLTQTVCESYVLNEITYTSSGVYTQMLTNASGCDSILTLNLTVYHPTESTFSQTSCESYELNGQIYTTSGDYTQVLQNSNGCDSTITLNLTIKQSTTSSINETACESFILNNETFTESGVFTQILTNSAGCDSILTLNLTVNQPSASSLTQTSCESYTLNGETYTSSGLYQQNLFNTNGCDSTITLNLSISQPTNSTLNETACESFTLNGETYIESGVYSQTLTNVSDCDSILTLNLTINQSTASSLTQASCESYALNGETYTASGLYQQNLINMDGCDSILTLNLTITQPTNSSLNETACDSFTLNGETYIESGVYSQTITNAAGCDSTITLTLTINTVDPSVTINESTITADASGASYQWVDCDNSNAIIADEVNQSFTAAKSGNYAVLVTENGCTAMSECHTITIVDIPENDIDRAVSIYPNPANHWVTIKVSAELLGLTYRIINPIGKTILMGKLTELTSNIELSELPAGFYLIKVGDQNQQLFKVLKY